jgi:moderate conductance mechanosensitive channel
MQQITRIIDGPRRAGSIWLAAFAVVLLSIGPGALAAQHAASAQNGASQTTPPKLDALLLWLADPQVQAWLKQQHPVGASQKGAAKPGTNSISHYLVSRLGETREHIAALAAALPGLPDQFARGYGLVQTQIPRRGTVALLVLVFAGLGIAVEWVFRKATQTTRQRLDVLPMETVNDRLRLVGARFAFAFGTVVAFALGSIGPFLARSWPPLLGEMVFGYLVAFLVTRVAVVLGHFLLSPEAECFRVIPMDAAAARFWCRRLVAFVTWFAFGWVSVGLLTTFGFSTEGRQLVAYVLGLGLLAIALDAVWRRPVASPPQGDVASHRLGRGAQNAILSVAIVLLWASSRSKCRGSTSSAIMRCRSGPR